METTGKQYKRRSRRLMVRLDENEYSILADKALRSGKTVSEFVRQALIAGKVEVVLIDTGKQETQAGIYDLINQIRRIGNNYNQVVHGLNIKKLDENQDDILVAMDKLSRQTDDLLCIVKQIKDRFGNGDQDE